MVSEFRKLIRRCVRFKINVASIGLSCSEKTLFKKTEIDKKHIDMKRKYKKEMEGVNENVSEFMHWNVKTNFW